MVGLTSGTSHLRVIRRKHIGLVPGKADEDNSAKRMSDMISVCRWRVQYMHASLNRRQLCHIVLTLRLKRLTGSK